jgi:hypothetical protein
MLRTIDRHAGFAIQKVVNIRGETIRYQTVAESSIGDAKAVQSFSTLKEAKLAIGAPTFRATTVTAPKSANPQNNKGYRAVRK